MIPEDYWPADVHIIAKDILRFHCVIWPAMLMAAGYDLPGQILSHGFLTVEGKKISKSLGNVIDPVYLADEYSTDALRYYLIREKTLGQDGNFSEDDLVNRFNSELADAFGNFVHRTLTFISNSFDGEVPDGEADEELVEEVEEKVEKAKGLMEEKEMNRALEEIISIVHLGNEYFQESAPWNAPEREAADCLYNCANLVDILASLFYPIIPDSSEKVAELLNKEVGGLESVEEFSVEPGQEINEPEILFEKIEVEEEEEVREDMISYEDFQELDMRIGRSRKPLT